MKEVTWTGFSQLLDANSHGLKTFCHTSGASENSQVYTKMTAFLREVREQKQWQGMPSEQDGLQLLYSGKWFFENKAKQSDQVGTALVVAPWYVTE